jgi:hypothetical protein
MLHYIMKSFVLFTLHVILLGWLNWRWDGWDMQFTWESQKCIQNFGKKNLKEKESLWDLGINGRIILKYILEKQGVRMWNGCKYLKTAEGQNVTFEAVSHHTKFKITDLTPWINATHSHISFDHSATVISINVYLIFNWRTLSLSGRSLV